MSKIKEVINVLEQHAPLSYQESYDNSGLLTGSLDWDIKGVLFSLDCLEEVVEEAVQNNCNVIVCHHPIIFSGLKSITGKNYVERTIIKAIKNDIAIIAWHTNLDNMLRGGVNEGLANMLGLKNLSILNPKMGGLIKLVTYVPVKYKAVLMRAMFDAGCGNIGKYSECSFSVKGQGTFLPEKGTKPFIGKVGERENVEEEKLEFLVEKTKMNSVLSALKQSHPYEEVAYEVYTIENINQDIGSGVFGELDTALSKSDFLHLLKTSFGLKVVKHTYFDGSIKKVAVCGGSGSFLINAAKRNKVDAYVTSDLKYHEFFDAENNLLLCDIGHYESEVHTIQLLHDVLSKRFSTFATLLTKNKTNPVNYYI